MGTIEENLSIWSDYDWTQRGDQWSKPWGGTEFLWWGTIFPRIQAFVPTETILQIGPGFGRCTQYLKDICQQLTIVDLAERCIQSCKERFAECSHITFHVNDGKSLAMVPDGSVDFVFSYDSLVHSESDVIQAYLAQLAKKLTPHGVGFIHHSSIGSYLDPQTGRLTIENPHWRAESMTAELFAIYCEDVGLQCMNQELISWGGPFLIDCFSLFTLTGSCFARPNRIVENTLFMEEVSYLAALSQSYKFTRAGTSG